MTERARKLRERTGDKLDEWFAHNPQGDAYEIVPVVLRAVVEEIGLSREDTDPTAFSCAEEHADYLILALATLLEAVEDG